jgi:hypothetical protein
LNHFDHCGLSVMIPKRRFWKESQKKCLRLGAINVESKTYIRTSPFQRFHCLLCSPKRRRGKAEQRTVRNAFSTDFSAFPRPNGVLTPLKSAAKKTFRTVCLFGLPTASFGTHAISGGFSSPNTCLVVSIVTYLFMPLSTEA